MSASREKVFPHTVQAERGARPSGPVAGLGVGPEEDSEVLRLLMVGVVPGGWVAVRVP